jgi:hypothetical protein
VSTNFIYTQHQDREVSLRFPVGARVVLSISIVGYKNICAYTQTNLNLGKIKCYWLAVNSQTTIQTRRNRIFYALGSTQQDQGERGASPAAARRRPHSCSWEDKRGDHQDGGRPHGGRHGKESNPSPGSSSSLTRTRVKGTSCEQQ